MKRWVWNSLRRGATPANVFSLTVLVVVAGGIAYASIPAPGTNLIHGCYDTRTGPLRVIDGASQTCASGEAALNCRSCAAASTH